jgi:murein DD-endopeptidase MepM/ murein hydrolase activator NlpD/cell wall-associated NlpC family hydrolase
MPTSAAGAANSAKESALKGTDSATGGAARNAVAAAEAMRAADKAKSSGVGEHAGKSAEQLKKDAASSAVKAAAGGTAAAFGQGEAANRVLESKAGKWAADKLGESKLAQKATSVLYKGGKRAVWVGVALLMSFCMLLLTLFGAGIMALSSLSGRGYLWDVKPDAAAMDVPQSYLDAYYKAGEDQNVPWTIIAAAGALGSYQGRVDPYKQPVPPPQALAGTFGPASTVLAGAVGAVVMPVEDPQTSSQYNDRGPSWSVNVVNGEGQHKGLDFRGATGTPVYAVKAGTVTQAGTASGKSWAGNHVVIDHGGGQQTWYAHLSRVSVTAGTQVSAGTQVGEIGETGNTEGPHLHFELHQNGTWADPALILTGAGSPTAALQPSVTGSTAPTSVYLVGDSLSEGTSYALTAIMRQNGIKYTEKALKSQAVSWGIAQVNATPPAPGSTVVVALGTNGRGTPSGFARQIEAMMQALPGGVNVLWVNIDDRGAAPHNEELVAKQAVYPNLRVLDWVGFARSQGIDPERSDPKYHVHLTPDEYKVRAKFIADAVLGTSAAPLVGGAPVSVNLSGPGVLPDPEGPCPTLSPAIMGTSLTQGAGPLMLAPDKLESFGLARTPEELQNVCTSADVLAAALRSTAEDVASEKGMVYPDDFYPLKEKVEANDEEANTLVTQFWTEVANRLDVFGSTGAKRCDVPIQQVDVPRSDWVSASISDAWNCELADARLRSVTEAYATTSGLKFDELGRLPARDRAVSEALQVAYIHSKWGTAVCDPKAPLAGVFPLSELTFRTHLPGRLSDRNRCDVEANILAAARAFKSGEVVDPIVRRAGASGWGAVYGGWSVFGTAVVGPPAVQAEFLTTGPRNTLEVTAACAAAAGTFLMQKAMDPANPYTGVAARDLQAAVTGVVPPGTPAFDAWINKQVPALAGSGACMGYNGAQWLRVLDTVSGEAGTPEPGTAALPGSFAPSAADRLDNAGTFGDVLAAMKARISARLAVVAEAVPVVGRTALVDRVSPTTLTVTVPPPAIGQGVADIGTQLIGVAISSFGGLWPVGGAPSLGYDGTTIPPTGNMAAAAVAWAQRKLADGTRYVAGAWGPNAYDCSKFTWSAYHAAGLKWDSGWALSYKQWWPEKYVAGVKEGGKRTYTVQIPIGQEMAGDLAFFDNYRGSDSPRGLSGPAGVDHVALVEDPKKKMMIHAANPKRGVVRASYNDSYYKPRLIGFARVIDPSVQASVVTAGQYDPLVAQAIKYQDLSPLGFYTNGDNKAKDWRRFLKRPLNAAQIFAIHLMVKKYKWPLSEWQCLNRMWWHESGWNHLRGDPNGGYGLGQATPGTKMAAFGADWVTNPETQVRWGLNFLSNYGNWWSYTTPVHKYPGARDSTPCGVFAKWKWSAQYNPHGAGNY